MLSSPVNNVKHGAVLGVLASAADTDTESQLSYASGARSIKPVVKVAWKGGKKVRQWLCCTAIFRMLSRSCSAAG